MPQPPQPRLPAKPKLCILRLLNAAKDTFAILKIMEAPQETGVLAD